MAEELRKAKGCLKAQKGHFTRNRASVETRLKAVMDEPDNEQDKEGCLKKVLLGWQWHG